MHAVAPEWATLVGIAIPLLIAVVSGAWAVWVRVEENRRAEWRRIEELIHVLHDGTSRGVWAQKVAVDELMSLPRRRGVIDPILRAAAEHFRSAKPNGASLAEHIDVALRSRR